MIKYFCRIRNNAAPYWIQELQDERILPTAKELLENGRVDEDFKYVSEDDISDLFAWLGLSRRQWHITI